jgi:hypothetical protein
LKSPGQLEEGLAGQHSTLAEQRWALTEKGSALSERLKQRLEDRLPRPSPWIAGQLNGAEAFDTDAYAAGAGRPCTCATLKATSSSNAIKARTAGGRAPADFRPIARALVGQAATMMSEFYRSFSYS